MQRGAVIKRAIEHKISQKLKPAYADGLMKISQKVDGLSPKDLAALMFSVHSGSSTDVASTIRYLCNQVEEVQSEIESLSLKLHNLEDNCKYILTEAQLKSFGFDNFRMDV